MKRVTFVEPKGVVENLFLYYNSFPLMGPVYLGTILHEKGFNVRIFSENMVGRDVPEELLDTDFLCLSMITLTAPRGYEIARRFRLRNPEGKIIIGGIHPSFLPEEAMQYADLVVCGEAENIIVDLLKYGWDEKVIHGTPVKDLDSLPLPNWSLVYGSEGITVAPIMTSRGCPYDCTFCTVTKMFGRGYRMNSPERVLEGVFSKKQRRVFFYDDNLAANPRRLEKILYGMIKKGFRGSWYAQLRANVTKNDSLVEMMELSGCAHVLIGFESVDDASLREFNKRQTEGEIVSSIESFHRHGIGVHGMFVLGADNDSPDIFERTVKFCRTTGLDTAQFAALTPFPGTDVFRNFDEQGRLLHKRWEYYDGMHVVFRPLRMSIPELQNGIVDAFGEFYSFVNILDDAIMALAKSVATLFTKKVSPGIRDAIVRLAVRSAFKKWKFANLRYLSLLEGIEANPGHIP